VSFGLAVMPIKQVLNQIVVDPNKPRVSAIMRDPCLPISAS